MTFQSTDFSYSDLKISDITDEILKECSKLFSGHYGVWKDGSRVKMGIKTLKKNCLFDSTCRLVIARINGELAGHAFYLFKNEIVWITQLVIHPSFRNNKIAKNLLKHSLIHNWKNCGLATSHPYAIKSLEGASGYLVSPKVIRENANFVLGQINVPYLNPEMIDDLTIDSNFDVDHREINQILSGMNDWRLGSLKDGHEFLGIIMRV